MRAVIFVVVLSAIAAGAAWADAASETAMALKQTYLAATADKIAEVHVSLHRAVNCLVGPKDSLFDSSATNPCAKAGRGAIVDSTDAVKKKHLQDAIDMAEMGIASSDLDKAIMLATGAAGAIQASQREDPNAPHVPR
jgi:hypothetical protein